MAKVPLTPVIGGPWGAWRRCRSRIAVGIRDFLSTFSSLSLAAFWFSSVFLLAFATQTEAATPTQRINQLDHKNLTVVYEKAYFPHALGCYRMKKDLVAIVVFQVEFGTRVRGCLFVFLCILS